MYMNKKENQEKKEINKTIWMIAVIMILAIVVRVINWPDGLAINCDEAMTAIDARSIAETGKDIYGTKMPIYFEAWLYGGQSALPTYLTALAINIFGFSLFSIRLPILLLSLISIFVIYLLGKKMFNEKTGLILMFLAAINPWHVMQSQWNLDCNVFPHMILIAVYLLYTGIVDKKKIPLYCSMLLFGLSMYAYGVSIFFVPLFLLIVCIYALITKQLKIREVLACFMIFFVIALPIVTMYIINFFKLNTIEFLGFTIQKYNMVTRSEDMLIFSATPLKQLRDNLMSLCVLILMQDDGFIWNSIPTFGALYLFSIIFVVVGIKNLISSQYRKTTKMASAILLAWTISALLIGILINGININRLNIIWYPLLILTGYGIVGFCEEIKWNKVLYVIVILYAVSGTAFLVQYYGKYQKEISNSATFDMGISKAYSYTERLNYPKVMMSNKIPVNCVYYLYALPDQPQQFVASKVMLATVRGSTQYLNSIQGEESKYKLIDMNIPQEIDEDIYLIRQSERKNVKNINDYTETVFGKYIVLEKRSKV